MKKYVMVLFASGMLASCNTATEVDELSVVQGDWELIAIERNDGTTSQIPIPARYTVVFNADGRFSARADCNQCNGGYTTDGNAISTGGAVACTRAFCQPPSFFDEYAAALSSMSSFMRSGAQLRIQYAGGELVYLVND